MKKLLLLLVAASLVSCGGSQESSTVEKSETKAPQVTTSTFGTLPNGTVIDKFTVENASGAKMSVISYGGILQSIVMPDKEGNLADVVLGHDNIKGYLEQNPYFGGIIGRFGNRIANAQFELDGETFQLAKNDGPNHLHGGNIGFDKVVWQGTEITEEGKSGVVMTYTSPDGDEGYPGTLVMEVTYLLGNDNSVEINYKASTDKKTVINLTNHSYFNLGPDKSTILNHHLELEANRFLPVDATLIPTGELRPVSGTPFDFSNMKVIGQDITAENEQLKLGGGFDHCWVLSDESDALKLAAKLYEPTSGRLMEVYTTEPAIQFYSGNFLDGTITGKGGQTYAYRSGLCLETQHYPDSPNQPEFPSVVLNPGETYNTTTKMVFKTK